MQASKLRAGAGPPKATGARYRPDGAQRADRASFERGPVRAGPRPARLVTAAEIYFEHDKRQLRQQDDCGSRSCSVRSGPRPGLAGFFIAAGWAKTATGRSPLAAIGGQRLAGYLPARPRHRPEAGRLVQRPLQKHGDGTRPLLAPPASNPCGVGWACSRRVPSGGKSERPSRRLPSGGNPAPATGFPGFDVLSPAGRWDPVTRRPGDLPGWTRPGRSTRSFLHRGRSGLPPPRWSTSHRPAR